MELPNGAEGEDTELLCGAFPITPFSFYTDGRVLIYLGNF